MSQLSVAALHSHPETKGKGEFGNENAKADGKMEEKLQKKDGRKMTEAGSNETPDGKETLAPSSNLTKRKPDLKHPQEEYSEEDTCSHALVISLSFSGSAIKASPSPSHLVES